MHRSKSSHGSRRSGRSESLFCNYPHRICMQDRYECFEYCIDHILEDKSAPFKQCNFVSTKTGQKCHKAAPKADRKEGYCPAHARKAAQMRHKAALKAKPTDAVKDTLDELDYYRPTSAKSVPEVPPSLATKILDYGSESDSDGDPLLLEQAWRGTTDSDAESVDSEQEDALKYAGVYTAEEAALITRDKLIRLQSLYINQFKRLQHIMREKRRSYLVALRQEREAFGIDFGVITDPKQKRKFREYQAARGFRRRKGKEAILYHKSKQRRIQTTPDYQGKQKVPLVLQCCSKSNDGEQCNKFSLPMAKFCKDHILMDPKQVLYVECAKGNGLCERPASLLAPDESCALHTSLPNHTHYKPYEPEPPPPPPPKPTPPPPPPPAIIPFVEPALPPAPILPSQLDSQIDQLLQFQPHFLEQQLQQHVYDTSQLLGSFSQPEMDIREDGHGDAQVGTRTTASVGAGGAAREERSSVSPDVVNAVPSAASQDPEQCDVLMDIQTDMHIDVETDMPLETQPKVEPIKRTKDFNSVPLQTSEDRSKSQEVGEPPITASSSSEMGGGGKSSGSRNSDPVQQEQVVDQAGKMPDARVDPVDGQEFTPMDAASNVQSVVDPGCQSNGDSEEPPGDAVCQKNLISSPPSSESVARRATDDHNYNQEPSDSADTADQFIDVTGLSGDAPTTAGSDGRVVPALMESEGSPATRQTDGGGNVDKSTMS